jgi:hypothetical protein
MELAASNLVHLYTMEDTFHFSSSEVIVHGYIITYEENLVGCNESHLNRFL